MKTITEDHEMNVTTDIRLKSPAHPGAFIRHDIIEPLGLSVTAASQALGVTRAALSSLLNERSSLSPEMALRIEKAFGVSMDTLMRMQNSYDIAKTRQCAATIDVVPYARNPSEPTTI
jgi:addiction module HigA family antidote